MEITNLSQSPNLSKIEPPKPKISGPVLFIVIILAATSGFWLSRILPQNNNPLSGTVFKNSSKIIENVSKTEEVKVGQTYGKQEKSFKDTALGVIQKGGINGEGTHTLIREGGQDQRAALTSSIVDLDLFVDRKVEIKGETNASHRAGWLLDVGIIKVLE